MYLLSRRRVHVFAFSTCVALVMGRPDIAAAQSIRCDEAAYSSIPGLRAEAERQTRVENRDRKWRIVEGIVDVGTSSGFFNIAGKVFSLAADLLLKPDPYEEIADIFLDCGQLDSAQVYLQRTIQFRDSKSFHVAHIYRHLGRPDLTLALYREAIPRKGSCTLECVRAAVLAAENFSSHLGRADSAFVYYRHALYALGEFNEPSVDDESNKAQQQRAEAESFKATVRTTAVLAINGIMSSAIAMNRPDSGRAALMQWTVKPRTKGVKDWFTARLTPRPWLTDPLHAHMASALADLDLAAGQPDSALQRLKKAAAQSKDIYRYDTDALWLKTARAYHRLNQPDSAFAYYHRALAGAPPQQKGAEQTKARKRTDIPQIIRELADAHASAGNVDSAIVLLQSIASYGHPDAIARIGRLEAARGDYATASKHYIAALQQIEIRGSEVERIAQADVRSRWLTELADLYVRRSAELGAEKSGYMALAMTELARTALISNARAHFPPRAVEDSIADNGKQAVAAARSLSRPVVVYANTDSALLAFYIEPNEPLKVIRHSIVRDSLAALVRHFRAELGAEASVRATQRFRHAEMNDSAPPSLLRPRNADAGKRLAALLIRARSPSQSVAEQIIVPGGALSLLPFAALPTQTGGYLGRSTALRYAPSLTWLVNTYARTDKPSANSRALVVGDPTMPREPYGKAATLPALPGAAVEARNVANALGVTPLTDDVATETSVRRALSTAPVIHLATHAAAYTSKARLRDSFLALAPDSANDGLLTLAELSDDVTLKLNAQIVVLSACQTAVGVTSEAEGVLGLQRVFLTRGARAVLASLWSVSDEATTVLMDRFYAHWQLGAAGVNKAEALRRAQQDVASIPKFENPIYWAGFQLIGAN